MTIREKLHKIIKESGSITYNELEKVAHDIGAKLATCERELRPSKSPQIYRVEKNGAIVRYEWIKAEAPSYTAEQFLKDFPSRPKQTVSTLF